MLVLNGVTEVSHETMYFLFGNKSIWSKNNSDVETLMLGSNCDPPCQYSDNKYIYS